MHPPFRYASDMADDLESLIKNLPLAKPTLPDPLWTRYLLWKRWVKEGIHSFWQTNKKFIGTAILLLLAAAFIFVEVPVLLADGPPPPPPAPPPPSPSPPPSPPPPPIPAFTELKEKGHYVVCDLEPRVACLFFNATCLRRLPPPSAPSARPTHSLLDEGTEEGREEADRAADSEFAPRLVDMIETYMERISESLSFFSVRGVSQQPACKSP